MAWILLAERGCRIDASGGGSGDGGEYDPRAFGDEVVLAVLLDQVDRFARAHFEHLVAGVLAVDLAPLVLPLVPVRADVRRHLIGRHQRERRGYLYREPAS